MARALAALAALVVLPACHNYWGNYDQDIYIENQGSSAVTVQIFHERNRDEDLDVFEVAAGGSIFQDYDGDDEVTVYIYRKSDNLQLYAARFDPGDFDDYDGTIRIIVTP